MRGKGRTWAFILSWILMGALLWEYWANGKGTELYLLMGAWVMMKLLWLYATLSDGDIMARTRKRESDREREDYDKD